MTNLRTKRCPRCEEMKLSTEFHRKPSEAGGLQGYCVACMSVYQRSYRKVNKTHAQEANKMWRAKRREEYRSQPAFKEKRCSKCRIMKDILQFNKNCSSCDGFQGQCKDCCCEAQIKCHAKNPKHYTVEHHRQRLGDKEYTAVTMIIQSRYRAKLRGIPFDLRKEDLFLPDKCPALGIDLDYSVKKTYRPNSPSLDRRLPELGYVKGNVSVISVKANLIKNDSTVEELAAVLAYCQAMS